LTPQIAKRAYELYEQRGRQDGRAVQDWEQAKREIRKDEAKAEPKPEAKAEPKPEAKPEPETRAETKPEAKSEATPEAKTEPKPETKAEPKPEAKAKTPSDLTPQIVKRVHELYEELGRKDLQAVEDLEKAEREIRKDDK
jgi:outer membrane biosynthesis protein TonB